MRGRKPSSPKVTDIAAGRLTAIDGGKGKGKGGGGPRPPVKPIAAPKWVVDKAGRDLWAELLLELQHRHQYLNLFKVELGRYCNAFAEYVKANSEIAKKGGGHIVKSPNGYPVQSPWVTIRNRNHEIMLRLAADLGLNPVAQQRLDGVQLDLFGDGAAPAPGADPSGGESRFGKYRREV